MKKCICCKEMLAAEMFYKHSQMKDGRLNKCKKCVKSAVSSNYRRNIEHYRAYERARSCLPHRAKAREAYTKTLAGKESARKSSIAWRKRNPIKVLCSTIVGNAVRDGKLTKSATCEDCGKSPKLMHGHHDDYAKPLVVRWLCPGCHTKWHRNNGEGLNAN